MIIVRHKQHQIMPWKNGLGTTREIFREPANQEGSDFSWRLSLAEVNGSGPFSRFPEVDRTIVQLSGPSMTLQHAEPGISQVLELYQPYAFAGDWQTNCTVAGTAQDLNLMTRRSQFKAQCRTFAAQTSPKQNLPFPQDARWLMLFTISGQWRCESSRLEQNVALAKFDTALLQRDSPSAPDLSLFCEEPGHLLVIALWQKGDNP